MSDVIRDIVGAFVAAVCISVLIVGGGLLGAWLIAVIKGRLR